MSTLSASMSHQQDETNVFLIYLIRLELLSFLIEPHAPYKNKNDTCTPYSLKGKQSRIRPLSWPSSLPQNASPEALPQWAPCSANPPSGTSSIFISKRIILRPGPLPLKTLKTCLLTSEATEEKMEASLVCFLCRRLVLCCYSRRFSFIMLEFY